MASPHLIRMQALKDRTRKALTDNIDRMRGPKALVIDPTLSGPLGLIAEKQLLKDHGVEKTYHLRSEPLETDQRRIMYLVREKIVNMKLIAEHIRQHLAHRLKLEYFVCIVPRKTIICERVLEEEGVYGEVQLGEFDLDLIPFEEDLLSMEVPDGFREVRLPFFRSQGECALIILALWVVFAVCRGRRRKRNLQHCKMLAAAGVALWRPYPQD